MSKRPQTLDSFFSPPGKRKRDDEAPTSHNGNVSGHQENRDSAFSKHTTYPFAIPHLPIDLFEALNFAPEHEGRVMNDQPDLDLVYHQPYIPKNIHRELFEFLRRELFFYRVQYAIKRGPVETMITTPRFTTVFGVDATSRFDDDSGSSMILDAKTNKPVPPNAYSCKPRPLPQCLDHLRILTQNTTGCAFNFALVNYYASGDDSISYHSDDERFLGDLPAIASFSLGAKRDFLLKHKPATELHTETRPIKLPLASGDMILMKGLTQSTWLHSIPKRKSGEADLGRINITFRRAMVKGGTENYYRYNVGEGEVHRWDPSRRKMMPWSM